MLKILVRLYLVIIIAYAGALLLIPDSIVGLFHDRFMAYNLDQAKGVQSMVVRQFRQAPREQWPTVAQELAGDFAPLQLQLLPMDICILCVTWRKHAMGTLQHAKVTSVFLS